MLVFFFFLALSWGWPSVWLHEIIARVKVNQHLSTSAAPSKEGLTILQVLITTALWTLCTYKLEDCGYYCCCRYFPCKLSIVIWFSSLVSLISGFSQFATFVSCLEFAKNHHIHWHSVYYRRLFYQTLNFYPNIFLHFCSLTVFPGIIVNWESLSCEWVLNARASWMILASFPYPILYSVLAKDWLLDIICWIFSVPPSVFRISIIFIGSHYGTLHLRYLSEAKFSFKKFIYLRVTCFNDLVLYSCKELSFFKPGICGLYGKWNRQWGCFTTQTLSFSLWLARVVCIFYHLSITVYNYYLF